MKQKRTFRDFMYDKNDILIAFLIIVVAMLIIGWCVKNVMNYPNTLDSVTTAEKVQSAVEEESKFQKYYNHIVLNDEVDRAANEILNILHSKE